MFLTILIEGMIAHLKDHGPGQYLTPTISNKGMIAHLKDHGPGQYLIPTISNEGMIAHLKAACDFMITVTTVHMMKFRR